MKNLIFLFIIVMAILTGCQTGKKKPQEVPQYTSGLCAPPALNDIAWFDEDNKAPLFDGLDVFHFPITTSNELAQKYVSQGLLLAYGFNHAEAARSFEYATRLDTSCAMAYFGFAYVLGPNYNAGMEPDNYDRAFKAIQKAVELSDENCTPKEKALIHAMAERYVEEPPGDRTSLDIAYSRAMQEVFKTFPDDPDIGTLYAESLMNLHPWDLYTHEGEPREWTAEILDALNRVMDIDPEHPGVHHFYIHAVEASSHPEQGLRSARLYDEGLVPGAGHLVHMPSHIYIRTGDYNKGTLSNIRAVEADSSYVTTCHAQGVYPLTYYPHNYHFMAATATLEGNSEIGIMAAQKVSDFSNRQLMKEPGWGTLQHYYSIPYYVKVKFGKWEEILKMQNEDPSLKYPEAIRHYARGMSYVGLGDMDKAKAELVFLQKYADDTSLKDITVWEINNTYDLLQIARRVLKGEILASEHNFDESIVLLREAVALEDALNYNEPPDWFFSVRHHLGAVQVEAEKFKDAVATYKEDLEKFPKNGWALHGLQLAYAGLNENVKFTEVGTQLEKIWATADIELTSSRIK